MTCPFLLVVLLILVPMILSATSHPVYVHPKSQKVKRHKALRHPHHSTNR